MQRRFLRGRLAIGNWRLQRLVGLALLCAVFALAGIGGLYNAQGGEDASHLLGVLASSTPGVFNVLVNNGNSITLNPNTTTTIAVGYMVSDADGCGDVFYNGNVTTTLYRSGVSGGASCLASTLNCYTIVSTSTHSCPGPASTSTYVNGTTTFQIYFFADATDASSTYPSEGWLAQVAGMDASAVSATATSSQVELNSLLAIALGTSTINYGTLTAGTDTTSTNQTMSVQNAGNTSSTLRISGTAFVSGSNSIATSSQHYATSTFTFGGAEQSLSDSATLTAGFLAPGLPLGPSWTDTTALPAHRRFHTSVANNNYAYVIGGRDTDSFPTSSVLFATINSTGSIGSWTETTALPSSTEAHGSVVHNNHVYVIGGQLMGDAQTSTVQFTTVNSTGSISTWITTQALPNTRKDHSSAVYNNYLYVVGGWLDGLAVTSSVLFATINSTGSIDSWTETTALPSSTRRQTSLAYNGYLYILGGWDAKNANTSTVLYAAINATGSLGSWINTTPLPSSTYYHTTILNNGQIYMIGGRDSKDNGTSTVLFASVNADGSLSSWTNTTALPNSLWGHSSLTNNGYVYAFSGFAPGSNTSTVSYNRLPSMNTYWGLNNPAATPAGDYTSTLTFTSVFTP